MPRNIALVSLIIILALVNWSIVGKEKHLAEGRNVYLELVPVDPRSLIQGDYMDLRFRLGLSVDKEDGYVVVSLDERNIGSFKRLYKDQALSQDEILIRYRVRNDTVKFATNAFFFQEGHGYYYQPARYGQFRVDDDGELLLVAMYDSNLDKLGPDEKE